MAAINGDQILLQSHFAESSNVVSFLDAIQNLAPSVGATAQIDSVDTGTNNSYFVVELEASGSFESVYKFLTLLENSPYELDFLSMDIHNANETNTPANIKSSKLPTWNANFKIQLLSFVP